MQKKVQIIKIDDRLISVIKKIISSIKLRSGIYYREDHSIVNENIWSNLDDIVGYPVTSFRLNPSPDLSITWNKGDKRYCQSFDLRDLIIEDNSCDHSYKLIVWDKDHIDFNEDEGECMRIATGCENGKHTCAINICKKCGYCSKEFTFLCKVLKFIKKII